MQEHQYTAKNEAEEEGRGMRIFNLARAVVGAMLVHFCVGSLFVYGNINPFIAAHLHSHQPWVNKSTTLIIQPLWLFFQTLITNLGLPLAERFGFRPVIYASLFGYILVNFAAAYINNVYLFAIVYGVGSGSCLGIGYLLTLYTAWTYLPSKKSLVTGICLLATGLNPTIMARFTSSLGNPENVDDMNDPSVLKSYKNMFMVLALVYSIIFLLVGAILPRPKMSKITLQNEVSILNISEDNISQEERSEKTTDELIELAGRLSEEKQSQLFRLSSTLQKVSGFDERRSLVFLEKQKISADMKNVVDHETALLFGKIGEKYIDNLYNLNVEEEARKTFQLTIYEQEEIKKRKSVTIENQIGIVKNRVSRARQLCEEPKLSKVLNNDQLSEILFEANNKLEADELNAIVNELLHSQCPSVKVGIRNKNFHLLLVMAFCSTSFNFFMNATWEIFVHHKIDISGSKASLILTIAGLFEAGSGLFAGIVLLNVRFKLYYLIQIALQIMSTATIYKLGNSFTSLTLYVSFSMYLLGADKTIYPTITQQLFGPLAGPVLYPLVYQFFAFASLSQFVLFNYVTSSFEVLFMLFLAFSCVAFACTLALDEKPDWSTHWTKNGPDDDDATIRGVSHLITEKQATAHAKGEEIIDRGNLGFKME